ncbi:fungal-specific transcription factor domain-containing protein [Lineolata rhizophorae]|uniref:Fungal-specific transcription factor domain-containing protein n=1 Tax=Lineolata rhizophorae TaxID=578093 RepID=A0A6A6P0Q9_9PEZI|nr:fungal-specific transcription factor domain-containing protein [Lineolata rhizophorae]
MATDIIPFGPSAIHARLSVSSSSQPSPSSSDSPHSTPTFAFSFRCSNEPPLSDEIVPKIEEIDEDDVEDVKVSPTTTEEQLPSPNRAMVKRPRGRPRKHPIAPPTAVMKPPKGRSKTGCFTCRRRKKKCDETKPICVHCQKNNVHCEGYPPKDYWRPGKYNRVDGTVTVSSPRDLPILIDGVETDLDRVFLDHFNYNLSRVLSLFTDSHNPFKEILLPMAIRHRGLMHSLLCLSGSHIQVASEKPNPSVDERQRHHYILAIQNLSKDKNMNASIQGDVTAIIDDPVVAQTLVLCLESICAGEIHGEYRPHMDAAKHLIKTQQSPNQEFQTFLVEFFVYHDVSNSVTSLDRKSVLMMEDFQLPQFMIQPEAGALLGVVDGLFGYISKIRALRDKIRFRRNENMKPVIDYDILSDAQAVDAALRSWVCSQQPDTPRYIASLLYRQCTWIYLHRTIMPSIPNSKLQEAVDEGLVYLRQLPTDGSTQSILLMPLFLLGCAAFEEYQRPPIRQAFADLQEYSNLGNIKYAKIIVETAWKMMDEGNEESWDWETIIKNMGWDFLVT